MAFEWGVPKASLAEPRSMSAQTDAEPGSRARSHLRVLVVDERGLMRDGLCALIDGTAEFKVVGSASIGADALRSAASLEPHCVVLDFPHAILNGPKLIASLKATLPQLRVVMLTFHKENHLIDAALRAGADGYVLKNDSSNQLFTALRSAAIGKRFISPALFHRVATGSAGMPDADVSGALTERERQVIRLIAAGRRTREMAQILSLSHKTIEKHRTSLMRKLGLRNATAVAAYAIAHGLAHE